MDDDHHDPDCDDAGAWRAGMDRVGQRVSEATARGGQAYARLVALAETRDSGQIRSVVRFIAATYNGRAFPFDLFELRGLDEAIGDDMLACLDALRWGRIDLYRLIPDGDERVKAVIAQWGLKWPDAD
jgi:hypothetical protein